MATESIEYTHEGQRLETSVIFDPAKQKAPGILIFHAWRGKDSFVLEKAQWISSLGYVGIVLDMYGKGILGASPKENESLMRPFIEDRTFLLKRIEAGMQLACTHPRVDQEALGAIGFCFGGLCALDLARSGAPIRGTVSVHGLLMPPEGLPSVPRGKILALHGYRDPLVPPSQLEQFQKEMTIANVDWQLHVYGTALHAFTNPEANDLKMGTVYDGLSEKRALYSIKNFFKEVYQE